MSHWMEDANYVDFHGSNSWVIGEDERADWYVPYRDGRVPWLNEWLWRPFRRWSPFDWLRYLNAKRRNEIVFIAGWGDA